MKLTFTNPILPIGEIKIPEEFSPPRLEKLKKCMDFYRKNGRFDRQIIVDDDKTLRDGYCAYLTAYLLGIETVKVLMVGEQAETIKAIPPAKPKPVKLCCVKDYENSIKRGDTGVFDPEVRGVVFGETMLGFIYGSDTFEQWKERNKTRAPHFWLLVQRPVKVGEWVYVTDVDSTTCNDRKPGDIFLVDGDEECPCRSGNGFIWGSGLYHQGAGNDGGHYLVLDGYKGEAE